MQIQPKLQCGHEFHLDCIGSAFNMKGAMQCPNCRKFEKSRWLYAKGSAQTLRELAMVDWIPDEDYFYGLSYPEMVKSRARSFLHHQQQASSGSAVPIFPFIGRGFQAPPPPA